MILCQEKGGSESVVGDVQQVREKGSKERGGRSNVLGVNDLGLTKKGGFPTKGPSAGIGEEGRDEVDDRDKILGL